MAGALLNEHLQPLAPFVSKTWRGEFSTSTPEKPMVDVTRMEPALNGNAVRILHSVNDGQYGGETLVVWDAEQARIVYFYVTTSGFYTRGTMTVGEGHYSAHEKVTGNSSGVTEVKSTTHLGPDGSMQVVSQYFKNGTWVEGHEISYHEDSDAKVVFR
jgi:hypothetical protein